MLVTPVSAPLPFPVPSKLCPQIFLAVCNLVAVAALPEQLDAVLALPIRLPVSVPVKPLLKEAFPFTVNVETVVVPLMVAFPDKVKLDTLSVLVED